MSSPTPLPAPRRPAGAFLRRCAALAWTLATAALLMVSLQARAEVVYGVNDTGIFSVDSAISGPATQLVTFSPALPANSAVTLATRPSDGMLFYLDSRGANPNLWRWDPATPTAAPVLVGTPGATTSNVIRLGFDANGNLYAMNSGVNTSIWKLDPATAGILSVTRANGFNSGNIPDGGDLCLHPTTGTLYMITNTELYTLTSTGFVTLLGTISGISNASRGCAFDRNSQLIVSQDTGIFRVNIGTLSATPITTAPDTLPLLGDLATNGNPNVMADLRVSKTASNLTPGNTVSFTVTVTNDGPSRATDVRVLDQLPAGLVFLSATPSQGAYSVGAVAGPPAYPAATWRVGTLNNGATATLTINATVTGTTPITNYAQVSYADQYDPDSLPGSTVPFATAQDDQASVTITPSPDLQVVKTATSSFAVGSPATYTLAVNNVLGSLGTGANPYTVTDVLPTSLVYSSAVGTGWACSVAGTAPAVQTVTCTSSAAIAAGGSNPNLITLTVIPGAAAAPSVSNTATVSGGGEPASNNTNNGSTVATAVCAAGGCPDLVVSKTASGATFTVGTAASYTLSVRNIGGLTTGASNYVISDTLPTGLTLATASGGAGWTIGAGWTCTVGAAGGSQVTCNSSIPILPGATSPSITFPVTVASAAAPGVTNTASVTGGGEPAAVTSNNGTSLATPVIDFDLTITKTKTTAANLVLGVDTATYTLVVNNVGGRASTGTQTVTDALPAGLTLNAAPTAGAGWTCTANTPQVGDNVAGGGRVVCSSSTSLPATTGASTSIVFPVRVRAAAAPTVTNTADVANPAESVNLRANNSSTATSRVNAPDLVITKSHNGNFVVGTASIYTLTVTNIGALATSTTDITVVDTLPPGLAMPVGAVAGEGTNWTCNAAAAVAPAGQVVTCTRLAANPIAANASTDPISLSVTPTAAAAAASPVTNNATVSGGNEPANSAGNNATSDVTTVYFSPVISKSFAPANVAAGVPSTLTLTISNPAGNPRSLAGLAFVDLFPTGMALAATPGLTNTCGGTVSPGTSQGDTQLVLSGGSTGAAGTSCTITVRVASTTVGANVNTTGEVTSTNSGTGAPASATLTVTAPANPVLTMVSSPDPVGVNMPVTLTYTINNSTVANTGLGFRHNFPVIGGVQMVWRSTVSNSCTAGGASLANPAGAALVAGTSTGISLIGGYDAAANATCVIVVTATVAAPGTATTVYSATANTAGTINGLTGTGGFAAAVNDTFDVRAVTLTKTFAPTVVSANVPSVMTFLLANGTGNPAQGGATPVSNLLAFVETLPAGLAVATVPAPTQCNGTVSAAVGGNTVTFSGGTLSLGQASCTVSVNVAASGAGTYNNTTGNVTGYGSNIINSATATLTVGAPSLVLLKTVSVTSDPVNGSTNPKNIPGAEALYTLRVTNSGAGVVDSNSTFISDPVPANADLFVGDLGAPGSGPVVFVDGTPPSALTWTYTSLGSLADDVDFSSDNGASWTYVPTPPYDPAVNRIRLNPKGSLAGAGGAGSPSFELRFRIRVR